MTKSRVQEALVTLYLRLNGYFTSGFIVHSPEHGANEAELDVLAIRLPHNSEAEREVGGAPELDRWDGGIDFIIGEVKSRGQQIQFNKSLRDSPDAIPKLLRWWGHLTADEVDGIVDSIRKILEPLPGAANAPTVPCPRDARVRAILFSPEANSRRANQAWFIPGALMMRYVWQCLRASQPRSRCSTVYDIGLWGSNLEPIVAFFKDKKRDSVGTFRDLLLHCHVGR
jgi:hypothetical protein